MENNIFEILKETMELGATATALIKQIKETVKGSKDKKTNDKNNTKITSRSYNAQIGSSGNNAQIGSSGYNAQIGSSGNYAKIGSSGYNAKIGSSGNYAKIGSSGYNAKIGSSGNNAQIGSSGYNAKIGSSGYNAQIGSSGDYAKIGSSGYNAKIGSSGDDAVISAIGVYSVVSAKKGSWITLAEYDNKGKVKFVKTEYVDSKKIKEDVQYCLYNKEFREYIEVDGIRSAILKKKKNVLKVWCFGSDKESYIIKDGDIYSHGDTLEEARESLIYKISNRDTSIYNEVQLDDEFDLKDIIKMYRVITGACEAGTRYFVENNKLPDKLTVRQAIDLTKGQYGNERFKEFFEERGKQWKK